MYVALPTTWSAPEPDKVTWISFAGTSVSYSNVALSVCQMSGGQIVPFGSTIPGDASQLTDRSNPFDWTANSIQIPFSLWEIAQMVSSPRLEKRERVADFANPVNR
jgi:hypothetical protein